MDLIIRQYLTKAKEHNDPGGVRAAYRLIRDAAVGRIGDGATTKQTACFSPELHVLCAEEALQLGCGEISTACLKIYFEGQPPANQFLSRAYLCEGQLTMSQSTIGSVEDFEKAALCFLKAIEISKDKPRYHFLVFNASVLYFQAARPLLRHGLRTHLVPSLLQVVRALEEVSEQDLGWRARLMILLVECLVDSGNTTDACSFAKVTQDFIKLNHLLHLYPKLFTLVVQHKLFETDCHEMTQQCTVIYKIQQLKDNTDESNVDKLKKEEDAGAELKETFDLLVECTAPQSAPVPPVDRVALLLELSLLSLQLKHPETASDCLKELRSASGDATAGQRIMMECVQCELCLLSNEGKMNDYSKACVEEHLKEIRKLDQCLHSAEREGEPDSMQAVCASQWRACLPLLQPNLRRNVKAELLRVAQVLENTHSMLLDTRCQVHSELAVIEEEDGRLDAAWAHLHKALLLDDGTWRERLSAAVRLLQLSRGRSLCQATAPRPEDKAAMLLQQTKNRQPQDKTDSRPLLVEIGLLLAPDSFQMVLDADNSSKIPSGSPGSSPVAQLSANAQHHSGSVRRVEGHLTRLGDDTNHKERLKLWAALAKTARKQEVWDVCRAACRFCLLYDDRRWNASKVESKYLMQEIHEEGGHRHKPTHEEGGNGHKPTQSSERDLLCLLAEVCFINAEATIQKLRAEGQQFNSPAVPPGERGAHVSAEDPHWAVYRDWIQGLSAHATSSFLRAAELGSEIKERWVVANAAVYLWNYNKHLLLAGEYLHLMPTLQRLVEMLRQTEFYGDRILCVLLCDAVARGFIQPLCEPEDRRRAAPAEDKAKKGAGKVMERASSLHGGVPLDPAALQDIRKALELCDYALRLSNCNVPAEHVPIAVRKRVVATWVQIKTHLQQQIGPKMDVDDECINESVSVMTRVLVGVEMLRYNSSNPRQMEFSVPSLATLVRMASDCLWSDAVVELQVWAQLAALCHHAEEHGLVLLCTQSALRLEAAAPCALSAVNQMLSSVACLKALSLVQESNGDPRSYTDALTVLLSSVSYAEKAEDMALCMAAARHYWNACLPLTHTPAERRQLQQPLEKILSALTNIGNSKDTKQGKVNSMTTLTTAPPGNPQPEASSESDLTVRVAIYRLLFYIHVDRSDWKSALQLLDKAIVDMPRTRHRLLLDKHRVLTRARLGQSVLTDMQRFRDGGGEVYCSDMWRQVALCARDPSQQLTCYQNAITSLVSVEGQWQKVGFLLEFGEWLYSQNFPLADTQNQVQWAIDILLHMDTAQAEGENEAQSNDGDVTAVKSEWPVGLQTGSVLFRLREVRRLDSLVRAYTLLAVMEDRTSPQYQLHLLRAYSFVLRIWKGSMAVVHEAFNETANNLPAQKPPSSASKKDKSTDRGKGKKDKDIQPPPPPTTTDEKPKRQFQEEALPSSPQEWARYACPDVVRQSFRSNRSPHCINTHSITDKTRCLFYLDLLAKELHSLSLGHLTLPVLHLAEIIAHDLVDRRSLSDLYRLRIVRICCQLGLETSSPFHGKLVNLSSIREQEQMRCRKSIALQQARMGLDTAVNEREMDHLDGPSGRQNAEVCAHDIWLGKAEVCLSMGLYQHARQLLAEARLVATELGDQVAVARTLLSLAQLACAEQNHDQALALLEKAQELGGDEDFWYGLTLTTVQATVGSQRGQEEGAHSKIDGIIKQGCTTLNSVVELRPNRAAAIGFLIVSLETRGAVEQLHVAGGLAEAGEALSTQAVQRLMSTCDTLTQCASGFIKLGYRERAAEAHRQHAYALRILAKHSVNTERKQRHLLDAFYQMQLAVSEQEHVALNGQNLLPAPASSRPESPGLTLAARRKLQRLRLSLAELCLAMLELLCAEQTSHALARNLKSSVEMALEDFTRSTPDPDSIEQEWACVGKTLGQVTMGQLAATCFPSPDSVETRARCLALKGKCQRLQAALKDPILPSALWDRHSQEKAWSEAKAAPSEREDAGRQKGTESSSAEDKDAELQRRRRYEAQQLLAQASETLAQAVNLCLQHKLPSLSTLADASQDMLECHGQLSPVVAGQYLALLQSCRSAAVAAEVLSGACSVDTGASRLSALISLRRGRRCQEEESPCSNMLEGVEVALSSLSKAYDHITINPNHLSILGELPSNLRILLLQHTEDGSELYGAFYEKSKSTDAPKGRPVQTTSSLRCSRVAKVSVCPRVLLMLRDRTATFSLETTRNLKDAQWHGGEGEEPGASQEERQTPTTKTTADETLETGFRDIVRGMEDYLYPILSQLDFSCFRHRAPSISDHHEPPKPREKDEKVGSDKGLSVSSPVESGETLVVLADRRLLQLPLEALSIMREEGLNSVTRDFSLQFLHNRLHRDETEKVESDNKKETKGGKATKGKGDQSRTIKVEGCGHFRNPSTSDIIDIVDLYEDTLDGTSLTQRMQMTLDNLSQHFAGWEGTKQTPSPSEVQQLLCKCCAFVYLGRERFTAIIPPSKLAALNLSECRMALLFDLVQNSATSIQSNTDINKSAGLLALDRPLETAVLLSLTGVRCIVLNQWHSSVQRNAHHMDSVLDRLLLAGMTSGQSVHALRKVDVDVADRDHKHTGLNDDASQSDSRSNGSSNEIHKVAISLSPFNCILYGLPNLVTI